MLNGILEEKEGIIDKKIARKENSIIERCVSDNGQEAITHYKVIKELKDYSILDIRLETGRTHQIRVHMQYIGHPVLGDYLYGSSSNLIKGHALHCYKLEFIHPISKQKVSYESYPLNWPFPQ